MWDVLQHQKQASLSVKVCDEKLRRIRTHDMGRLVAVGNQKGTTYLVEFSENLSSSNKNDKALLTAVSLNTVIVYGIILLESFIFRLCLFRYTD